MHLVRQRVRLFFQPSPLLVVQDAFIDDGATILQVGLAVVNRVLSAISTVVISLFDKLLDTRPRGDMVRLGRYIMLGDVLVGRVV